MVGKKTIAEAEASFLGRVTQRRKDYDEKRKMRRCERLLKSSSVPYLLVLISIKESSCEHCLLAVSGLEVIYVPQTNNY